MAPPTSTTTTSPTPGRSAPSPEASSSTAVSTRSGVAPWTIAAKAGLVERCLPPITWRRNIARIAARADAGSRTPIRGTTLPARTYGVPAPSRRAATSGWASTLPATTTGPDQRADASAEAHPRSTSLLPPSVPPVSSTTSGRARRRASTPASSRAPAETWTTRPPLESATRRPASAVTSCSLPTTPILSPPPADEQARTGASAARASSAVSADRQAPNPSITSVSTVVRCSAFATSRPSATSTSAALVNVDPKSTHTTTPSPAESAEPSLVPGRAVTGAGGVTPGLGRGPR